MRCGETEVGGWARKTAAGSGCPDGQMGKMNIILLRESLYYYSLEYSSTTNRVRVYGIVLVILLATRGE